MEGDFNRDSTAEEGEVAAADQAFGEGEVEAEEGEVEVEEGDIEAEEGEIEAEEGEVEMGDDQGLEAGGSLIIYLYAHLLCVVYFISRGNFRC